MLSFVRRVAVRVFIAAEFLVGAAVVAAQTPSQPTFRSTTNLVQVDVVITGDDGHLTVENVSFGTPGRREASSLHGSNEAMEGQPQRAQRVLSGRRR
jgi:hypothetical protein